MTKTSKKISLSLPSQLVGELDTVTNRIDVSRSALVSGLLERILPQLVVATGEKSFVSSGRSSRRYTGGFVEELHQMLVDLSFDSLVLCPTDYRSQNKLVSALKVLSEEFDLRIMEMEKDLKGRG